MDENTLALPIKGLQQNISCPEIMVTIKTKKKNQNDKKALKDAQIAATNRFFSSKKANLWLKKSKGNRPFLPRKVWKLATTIFLHIMFAYFIT